MRLPGCLCVRKIIRIRRTLIFSLRNKIRCLEWCRINYIAHKWASDGWSQLFLRIKISPWLDALYIRIEYKLSCVRILTNNKKLERHWGCRIVNWHLNFNCLLSTLFLYFSPFAVCVYKVALGLFSSLLSYVIASRNDFCAKRDCNAKDTT